MLPCNVIVQELDNEEIEIAAVDPVVSMQAVENEKENFKFNRIVPCWSDDSICTKQNRKN